MKFTTYATKALAVFAITASLVIVGQFPDATMKVAHAGLSLGEANFPARISAGDEFMCMVSSDLVRCSGLNADGQLGDGTTTSRNFLKTITTHTKIKSPRGLATGKAHACAVAGSMSDSPGEGLLYCWGDNQYGQLGDGSTQDSPSPVLVANNGIFVNANVVGVIAGDNHTCAITSVSSVNRMSCWGLNNKGQLGDNSTIDRTRPVEVLGAMVTSGVRTGGTTAIPHAPHMAGGAEHTCASRTADNVVWCWGENSNGQLGNNSTTDSLLPVSSGASGSASSNTYNAFIAAGGEFSCASAAVVQCWGDNSQGQMGNGGTADVLVPTDIPTFGGFTNTGMGVLTAGGQTVCAIKFVNPSYYLWCWGANNGGQIGDNTIINKDRPTLVSDNSAQNFTNGSLGIIGTGPIPSPQGISISRSITNGFACVTKWCWGKNNNGQLAQGNSTDSPLATKVKVGTFTADAVTGAQVTAVLKSTGIDVTFTGIPASAITLASITVAPTTQQLAPNQPANLGEKAYMIRTFNGAALPIVVNNSFTVTVPKLRSSIPSMSGPGTITEEAFVAGGSYHLTYYITGASVAGYLDGWELRNGQANGETVTATVDPSFAGSGNTTDTTTSGATNTSTTAPAVGTTTTTPAAMATTSYATAIPGVTVVDPKVYSVAPKKVAGDSAIIVLSPIQAKTLDIVSRTPSVCLPNDEDLVFLDEGRCIAEIVNAKTRKVLRTLKTTVVDDDIADLKVGNEIAILSPLYFKAGTATLKPGSIKRLNTLKSRILSAGSVLVAGHSGNLMGNTPQNRALSQQRAQVAISALKSRGSQGPFAIAAVGALDPATTVQTMAAQDQNRRVVIVLIP